MRRRRVKDTDKKISVMDTVRNTWYALKWLFSLSPLYVIVTIISEINSQVILMLENTFLIAYIVDCVQYGRPFTDIFKFFIPVTAVVVFNMLFFAWMEVAVLSKAREKVDKGMRLTLYEKAANMDMARYDDPTFYNDFVWAMQEAPAHIHGTLQTVAKLCSTVALILCMGIYVLAVDPIGILFVVGSMSITLLFNFKINKRWMRQHEELMPHSRRADYIKRVFYLNDYAKDMRMGEMTDMLYDDFDASEKNETAVIKKHAKPIGIMTYIQGIFWDVLSFDALYMTYLLFKTLVLGALSYGSLLALYRSASNLQNRLSSFTWIFPEFQQHAMYIEKVRTFREAENALPDVGEKAVPAHGAYTLCGVDFAYPGAKDATLHDVSMTIPAGAKVALVGYNGAGKSTLVKLLMRLYDPTVGEIRYGDHALAEYPLSEYRSQVAVLFQDYQMIAASLADNITMGEPLDEERLLDVLHQVGFDEMLEKLPLGIHTPLTKEFDENGVNLSGGEAQKIAIARVLYSSADVFILDEPSSALDPLSEYRLNETIRELAADKTVIFISHRLSTTRMADTIFMLENGRVIEHGSHDALMSKNGKYAEMFRLQAEKYR
ncbi:MAG: ABC transporter ATP-binding protein [Clostridia bacterium]|nr:ABC transporter ATP-binding protein [Clostridia bacterium]